MQHASKFIRRWALLSILSASGCANWCSSAALPGISDWKDDRAIVKKAQNDPFPSPQQVGLK